VVNGRAQNLEPGSTTRENRSWEEKMSDSSPSTTNMKHTVFFSHKAEDESVINSLINLLKTNTDDVNYFISANIEKGIDWREAIANQLTQSSYLVLVFTDPDEDWGWCLFETGFFEALSRIPNAEKKRRIYCLHHPTKEPPSPIRGRQTIPATPKDIQGWLGELFQNTGQSIERIIGIPNLANEI
jgi:hypothetical protein